MFKHVCLRKHFIIMSLIEKLSWRYATKKFEHTKKLSTEQLDELLKAVQLSPSSIGLQAYKIIVVEDEATRQKLREAAHGQSQITDASQLIVFASETRLDEEYAKNFINLVAKTRHTERENLAGYEQMIVGNFKRLNDAEKLNWSHK